MLKACESLVKYGSGSSELGRTRNLLASQSNHNGLFPNTYKSDSHGLVSRRLSNLLAKLALAGIGQRELRALFTRVLCVSFALIGCSVLLRAPLLMTLVPLAPISEWILVNRRVARRSAEFERDYTAMLLALASAIRTGLDPLVALASLHHLFPKSSVICKELLLFKDNVDRGMNEERAIRSFAAGISIADIEQFKIAMILARKEGSSLSVCLERLARVTRHRQSFRRKVKAAVAMQKLSAIGIAGCTAVIGLTQFISNPESMRLTVSHPQGSRILLFGVSLILVGLVWMARLVKPRM